MCFRLNGDYKKNPFVFKRTFGAASQSIAHLNVIGPGQAQPIIRQVHEQRQSVSALRQAWRMMFGDQNTEPDLEAQHPEVEVRPEQHFPSRPQTNDNEFEGTDTDAYISSAYLSFNGRSLNSIPLEGSTKYQDVEQYFMFQKVFYVYLHLFQ